MEGIQFFASFAAAVGKLLSRRIGGGVSCLCLRGEDWDKLLGRYTDVLERGMQRRLSAGGCAVLSPTTAHADDSAAATAATAAVGAGGGGATERSAAPSSL